MRTIAFITCVALFPLGAYSQKAGVVFPAQGKVTAAMNAAMKSSDLPAIVAVGVNSRNQKVSYSFGKAVWNEDPKVTTRHIFRIWSMTKLITSIAAMQLVEKGLIKLDTDLSTLLPEMAKIPILTDSGLVQAKKPITLRHLLTHTSGFGYTGTDEALATFDRSKWEYKDLPRRFESGTQFLYGSSTFWVGKLVEKVSKVSLEKYFRQHITGPLKMNRTWFNLPDSLKHYVVSQGTRGPDGKQPLTESPNRLTIPLVTEFRGDGGLFSSPDDFTVLLKCLLNYGTLDRVTILKKQTILEMTQNQVGSISLDPTNAYFEPGFCCDMNGLIAPNSKWGLAWLIDTQSKAWGPKAGTVSWGGAFNTYFYLDYKSGVAASIYTQHVPFNHPETINLFRRFSEILYSVR